MKHSLRYFLLLLALSISALARATTPPATPSLAAALNPDGTLKPEAAGAFDARKFRMSTAPDGRPVFRPAGVAGAGDERWQDGFGLPNGPDGDVLAVLRVGTNIYIGGNFTAVGAVAANRVAKWDGTVWSSLGTGTNNGVSGPVNALAVGGSGDVYVAGDFIRAGSTPARRVARWNGTAWSSLGTGTANGLNDTALALAVDANGNVYAGGRFSQAGGATAYFVARWNGTAWSPLGMGTDNMVFALAAAPNGGVYVGGAFKQAGAVVTTAVALWNGTGWESLGTGISDINGPLVSVGALALAPNGDLYAGGSFSQAGGVAASNVAKWDGTAWSSLGTGNANGTGDYVKCLAIAGTGEVYVGGTFAYAGGLLARRLLRWNGTDWSLLGTTAANGLSDIPTGLAVAANGELYAGGYFGQAGRASANRIARWNGTAWNALGAGPGAGVNGDVLAVAVAPNGNVYVGGAFTQAGTTLANSVARWDGTAWSSLGTGVAGSGSLGIMVDALAVAPNGDLYIGGRFGHVGSAAANNVARWNGTAWSSLGAGTDNEVYALALTPTGDLYAGGHFFQAGGITALCLARWNGAVWNALGTGINSDVYALAISSTGAVYVGGAFTQAGGMTTNGVARWDGTAWSSLGANALNSGAIPIQVRALAVAANGDLYAAGNFSQVGTATANGVARWDGTAWSPLGTGPGAGTNSYVPALAVAPNGDVYAGGSFNQANGTNINRVDRWNGATWSSLGTGLNSEVYALAFGGATNKLYAGGSFSAVGDFSKPTVRFAVYDPNALLAAKAAYAAPATFYPNPAHGTATLRLPAGAPRLPLTLSDALGRAVRRYPAPASAETELDLRGLPAGAYLLRCGQVAQRLVVE
jgi:hypothetical protein